jgi:quercetin dioxygenase-like cupin family protein
MTEARDVVEDHPQKVRCAEVGSDGSLSAADGWVDMGVQWIVTNATIPAARSTVFGITTFPPGAKHAPHRHPHAEEVEYLVSGSGLARVGDVEVTMGTGDAVFVAQNETHGFWNTSDTEPAVMIWCYGGASSLDEAGYVPMPD